MKKTYTIILSFVLIVLTFTMPTMAQEDTLTVFSENDWIHVAIGGDTVCSIVWEQFDEDVQIVFYAYNDAGLSFNQFWLQPDITYSDPFDKFQVCWNGEITVEQQIKLNLSSIHGQITTIKERFGGDPSSWDRPGTLFEQRLMTHAGELKDVMIDDEHVCSFEWTYETVNNETKPQLTVYSSTEEVVSVGTLTSTYTSIVEFFDQVGFMYEKMGDTYVRWMLYSGYDFKVRDNQGFGTNPLPFFKVSPADLDVYPGEIVTVEWTLPEGVTEYEASWEDKQISEYIRLVDEDVYNDQYETTFEFLDSAKNQKFTIKVSCNKYGTIYQGKAKITVLVPLIESILWVFIAIPLIVIVVYLIAREGSHRTRSKVTAPQALKESTY